MAAVGECEDAALAQHDVEAELVREALIESQRQLVDTRALGIEIVRADDRGVSARVAASQPTFLDDRNVADAMVPGEIVGGGEPMPAAPDDEHIVLTLRLGTAPELGPVLVERDCVTGDRGNREARHTSPAQHTEKARKSKQETQRTADTSKGPGRRVTEVLGQYATGAGPRVRSRAARRPRPMCLLSLKGPAWGGGAEQVGIKEHVKDPVDEDAGGEPKEAGGEPNDQARDAATDHSDIERGLAADTARQHGGGSRARDAYEHSSGQDPGDFILGNVNALCDSLRERI